MDKMSQTTLNRDTDWFVIGIIMLAMLTKVVPYTNYSLMVKKYPVIPNYICDLTKSFLHTLFNKKYHTKLNGGAYKNHPYFAGVNWMAVGEIVAKDVTVPWISIKNPEILDEILLKTVADYKSPSNTNFKVLQNRAMQLLMALTPIMASFPLVSTIGRLFQFTFWAF